MTLKELFDTCDHGIQYKQAGDSVNYAFSEEGNMLTIYFQGSNSITDWVRNFFFRKKPYKDMDVTYKVHAGFLAAWKEVEDIIIEKITETTTIKKKNQLPVTEYKWQKIIVVGYSHGGALAAFCHECVWFWRPDLRTDFKLLGYGFEAPRIYAGFKVKKQLTERWQTFRVIRNKTDIVTHCPPRLFGYTHVGNIIKIGNGVELIRHTKFKCVDAHFPDNVSNSLEDYQDISI